MHSHVAHTPAAHVCIDPHAVVVYPRPSELHTRVELPTHVDVPGVQSHAPHRPVVGVQLVPLEHGVVAPYPRPSGLHACVPVEPTQPGVPGVHTHGTQTPPPHDWPAAHATIVYPRPSAAHVSTTFVVPLAQRVVPGVQTRV